MDAIYSAVPPAMAIVISLFFGVGGVIRRGVRGVCLGRLSDAETNFVEIVVKGALALETFLISGFAGLLTAALLLLQWTANGQWNLIFRNAVVLGGISVILVGYVGIIMFVRSKDYEEIGASYVSFKKVDLEITYRQLLQWGEIALNGFIIALVFGSTLYP